MLRRRFSYWVRVSHEPELLASPCPSLRFHYLLEPSVVDKRAMLADILGVQASKLAPALCREKIG
jgi:hypothetical protein